LDREFHPVGCETPALIFAMLENEEPNLT